MWSNRPAAFRPARGAVLALAGSLIASLTLPGPHAAASTSELGGLIAFSRQVGAGHEIFLYQPATGVEAQLTSDGSVNTHPALSPDGKKVAFTSNRTGNNDVWVIGADGFDLVRLTTHGASDGMPAWSPGGDKIAFVSNRAGSSDIFVMNADGSQTTRLTSSLASDGDPTWSPDGAKIAFSRVGIWVMNAGGSGQTQLTASGTQPAWSPDGAKIAFHDVVVGPLTALPDVYVVNSNGSGRTNLTRTAFHDSNPAWSPDGGSIAFQSDRLGAPKIFSMRADGSAQTRVVDSDGADHAPSWSVVPPPPTPVVQAVSTFDVDDEGWRVAGGAANPVPEHFSAGGNPGGFVRALDDDPGARMEWVAPAKFRGDLSATYGGTLRFDRRVSTLDGQVTSQADVRLTGSGTELRFNTPNPGVEWIRHSVPIVETAWRKASGQIPTAAEFLAALASVTDLRITAEYSDRVDHSDLDNVVWTAQGLSLVATRSAVPARPSEVPWEHVPALQPHAPVIETAPLDLLGSEVAPLDLLGSEVAPLDLLGSEVAPLDLLGSDVAPLDLLGSEVAPLVREGLSKILLAQIPVKGDCWQQVAGVLGEPLQTVTLLDVVDMAPNEPACVRQITLGEIDMRGSPLGSLSPLALVLGRTPLSAIQIPGPGWCARLEGMGYAGCGAELGGLTASLVGLQMGGVSFRNVGEDSGMPPLPRVRMSDVDLGAGPAPIMDLGLTMDMSLTSFGSLRLADMPQRDEVVDCSHTAVDCDNHRLVDVSGHIKPTARIAHVVPAFGHLALGEVVMALLGVHNRFYAAAPEALGLVGYGDDEDLVSYELRYQAGLNASNPVLSVELPPSFRYRSGSALVGIASQDTRVTFAQEPEVTPRGLRWEVEADLPLGEMVEVDFRAHPGLTIGTFSATASATAGGIEVDAISPAPVTVTESFEPNDTPAEAFTCVPGFVYVSHLATDGDKDFCSFPAPAPGSRIQVLLNPGPQDADLVVYHPLGAEPEPPLRALRRADPRVLPLADTGVGFDSSSTSHGPEARADVPLEPGYLVAGMSAHLGTQSEAVETVATEASGRFVVQVSRPVTSRTGDGADLIATDQPYTLVVRTDPPVQMPPAQPRSFEHSGSRGTMPSTIAEDRETLFVVNRSRMAAMFGDSQAQSVMDKLNTLAARPEVKGVVLGVDAVAAVRTAFTEWDTASGVGSFRAANQVVRAVNDAVDARLPEGGGSVRYVVLVGSDELLPMARLCDGTLQASERGYAGDTSFTGANNALRAALLSGRSLSDDPYGTFNPLPWQDCFLYVPDTGVGRLVETPAEIVAQIDRYLQFGALDLQTALTTGYDFFEQMAAQIDGDREAVIGSAQPDLLGTWSAAELESHLRDDPEIASINAHFDHARLLPGDRGALFESTRMTGPDSASPPAWFGFSMGCHSGLNVADVLVGQPTPVQAALLEDWPQVTTREGALAWVGQTGFGLGFRNLIAGSEWLMVDMNQRLQGGATVGESHMLSKHAYLADQGVWDVFDAKVLAQSTLYGLPFLKVGGIGDTPPAPVVPAPPTSVDPVTGLEVASVEVTSQHELAGRPGARFYTDATYGATQAVDRPIQPRFGPVNVHQEDKRAHGALVTGLASQDFAGFPPAFAHPLIGDQDDKPDFAHADTFPAGFQNLVRARTADGVERDQLVMVTGQFTATGWTPSGGVEGVQRLVSNATVEVYYSDSDDFTPPVVHSADGWVVGPTAAFTVRASDPVAGGAGAQSGAVGVSRVVVCYAAGSGGWTCIDLVQDPSDPTRWSGGDTGLVGDQGQFFVQAVDAAGNVGFAGNKGVFFTTSPPGSVPSGITQHIEGTHVDGWYTSARVALTGPDGVTFETSLDGGAWSPYGGPVDVPATDGVHTVAWQASIGATGTVVVPVDASPPQIHITTPGPEAVYAVGVEVASDFRCTDAGVGVLDCDGPATLDTSTVGQKSFVVAASDRLGHSTSLERAYRVGHNFEGFFSPVSNDAVNRVQAGSGVPVKWKLLGADGEPIRDLDVVQQITSTRVTCPGQKEVNDVNDTVPLTTSDLHYDQGAEQYVYNWKTASSWKRHCRVFELTLDDGVTRTALFQFT